MPFDLKAAAPDTSFGANAFLFGADSQSATDPSVYGITTVFDYLRSLANTWSAAQTIASGTLTASAPALNITQTWNNSGVTFTGMRLSVTNTSSNAASSLADFRVGGSSVASVGLSGSYTILNGSGNTTLSGGQIFFTSTASFPKIVVPNLSITNAANPGSSWIYTTPGIFSVGTSVFGAGIIFSVPASGVLQLGDPDAAAPVAQGLRVQSVVAGTSNTAGQDFTVRGSLGTGTGAGGRIIFQTAAAGSTGTAQNAAANALVINANGSVVVDAAQATPAGGAAAACLLFGTTSGFGIYFGSGVPTVSAGQGSIYLRSDGSSTSTRLYVNTDGSTTWTNFTSAA